MMSRIKLLLMIIDLILIYTVDSSNVHYIMPLPTTPCPEQSCLTLSILVANTSNHFDSTTTIVFLEGFHTLDSGLVVSNIDGSIMLSTITSGTAIVCSERGSLKFKNITQVQIKGLEFIGCSSKIELVDQFLLEDSRLCGGNYDSALHLNHTNTSVVRSLFVSNTAGAYQSHVQVLAYLRDNRNKFRSYSPVIQSNSARVGGALTVTTSTVLRDPVLLAWLL